MRTSPSTTTSRRPAAIAALGVAVAVAAPLALAAPAAAAPQAGPVMTASRFPDSSTTGVPAGVTLRPSGSVTVTQNGTVLSGLDIKGTVTVEADDVVIRNSRIRSTGTVPVRNRGANLVIENTEIDGQGKLGPAVAYNKYTLRRVNIHNVGEGPRIAGGNVVIEDSYIHHLVQVGKNHTDAIQAVSGKSNIVIRRNNVQMWNPDIRLYGNAAFQFGEEDGIVRGCLVEGNLMNGGNYTINGGGGGTRGAACTFRDNRFGTNHRYGIKANLGPNVVWEASNKYDDGSAPKVTAAASSVTEPSPTVAPQVPFAQIAASPDSTGDRIGDLFTVDRGGRLFFHRGAGGGRLAAPRAHGTGWASLTIYAPGDWNGDRRGDLVAVDSDGNLLLYPGDGSGGLRARTQIGHGWTGYRIVPAGDVDNNGTADLLAIDAAHRLWLYPGDGRGGFGSRTQVGNGWKGFELYAAGDMNGDGLADILSIDSAGRLWFYAGRGAGYFHTKVRIGHGWSGFGFASGGDFDGDGINDLMGRDRQGRLWFYAGRPGGSFSLKSQVAGSW